MLIPFISFHKLLCWNLLSIFCSSGDHKIRVFHKQLYSQSHDRSCIGWKNLTSLNILPKSGNSLESSDLCIQCKLLFLRNLDLLRLLIQLMEKNLLFGSGLMEILQYLQRISINLQFSALFLPLSNLLSFAEKQGSYL